MGKPKAGTKAVANAAAGILKPVTSKVRKAKPLPKNPVKPLDVGSYADLKKRAVVGDKLEHDHIPSSAALKKAEEKRLGRKLTDAEKKAINDRGTTIEVPKDVHAKSDTYRGNNTPTQIDADASNLSAAADRDYATNRKNLIAYGYTPSQVDAALNAMRAENRKKGI